MIIMDGYLVEKGICGKILFNIENAYQIFFDDYIQIKSKNNKNYDTKIINVNSQLNDKSIYLQNINILNVYNNYFVKIFNKIMNEIIE